MRGLGISQPMFFVGIVEDNDDKQLQGRVKVRAFGIHGTHEEVPTTDLPWALCVQGGYDPNAPIPRMGSFVFGMFIDGDEAQHPLVLGMIPSQYVDEINPIDDGYSCVPLENGDILAQGYTPEDFGEPPLSKLVRGERVETTFHADVSVNAVQDQKIANMEETWSQPPSAYSAKYPYNRVIQTARHTIELDDTPNAERIMIHHKSGAFVQIDAMGTVTERAEGDRYEINIGTKHESSEASVVTINGNAHVYVRGNKTEEIEGDYKLLVHGTTEIGAGGNLFLNAGDSLMARGSTTRIESSIDALTLFGKEQIQIEAEKQINVVSNNIKHNALLDYAVYSTKGFKFSTPLDFHLTASNIVMAATCLVPPAAGITQLVTGTVGTPVQAGFNLVVNPLGGVNIGATTGSFAGIWNASVLNGGIITGTTGNFTTSFHTDLNALNADVTNLSAPLPLSTAPGSPCAPNTTNPLSRRLAPGLPTIAIPSLPVLIPPAISDPTPPLFGKASGWAYPVGNGPEFLSSVLTSPFSFISDIIAPLDFGGYGITRAQMPEPPSKSMMCYNNAYYPRGYSVGIFNTSLED